MKLKHERYDQLAVLTLDGDLAVDGVEPFRKEAQRLLDSDVRDFALDLKQVEFVDSRGLEAMLWLQEQAGERLGQMRLAGAGENLETILRVTRLSPRFERHADLDAAVKSLRI